MGESGDGAAAGSTGPLDVVEAVRRTEAKLAKLETRLGQLQRLEKIGDWEWDVGTDEVTWSPEAGRIFGLEPDMGSGPLDRLLARIHPEDRSSVLDTLRQGAAAERPFALAHRVLHADGSELWLHTRATVRPDPAQGAARVVAITQDVTDRKRLEAQQWQLHSEQLARAEAEAAHRRSTFLADVSHLLSSSLDYESTLAQVADLLIPAVADSVCLDLLQPDGTLAVISVAHADPAQAALGRELRERFPIHLGADHGVASVLRTGVTALVSEVDRVERAAHIADPECRALVERLDIRSYIAVPLLVRGRIVGVMSLAMCGSGRCYVETDVVLAEDIGRRVAMAIDNARLYREAQEVNRLKDEFLATLSHELRTPLNAIVGWTYLLREGQNDEATLQRGIEAIHRNAQVQTQLISDVLDVSRIVTGKLHLERRTTDLGDVIEAALDTVRPQADAKGVALLASIAPAPFVGDPDRLQQVVWNLLINGINFAPRGGRVRVRLETRPDGFEIQVEDDGPGVDPEFLPYVFERFRQYDSSTTRSCGGLGLGLSIVRDLVAGHGGSVQVGNKRGAGAVFTVWLPAVTTVPAAAPATTPEVAPAAAPAEAQVERALSN